MPVPLWRNGLARWTSNSKVVGSNPISGDFLTPFIHADGKIAYIETTLVDEVAEWLRRWTANPLGSARVGSNPILVACSVLWCNG